jgi:hypothetical protein
MVSNALKLPGLLFLRLGEVGQVTENQPDGGVKQALYH